MQPSPPFISRIFYIFPNWNSVPIKQKFPYSLLPHPWQPSSNTLLSVCEFDYLRFLTWAQSYIFLLWYFMSFIKLCLWIYFSGFCFVLFCFILFCLKQRCLILGCQQFPSAFISPLSLSAANSNAPSKLHVVKEFML